MKENSHRKEGQGSCFGFYSDWSRGEVDRWARIDLGQFLASQATVVVPQD